MTFIIHIKWDFSSIHTQWNLEFYLLPKFEFCATSAYFVKGFTALARRTMPPWAITNQNDVVLATVHRLQRRLLVMAQLAWSKGPYPFFCFVSTTFTTESIFALHMLGLFKFSPSLFIGNLASFCQGG